MMRIAYVCTDPGVPVFGSKGCSIHVQEVVRALGRRGFDVELHVARVGGDPPASLASVPIVRLPRHRGDDPRQRELAAIEANAALTRSLASRPAYDLVYERHSLWSSAAMEFARATGTPGVLEVNAPLVEEQAIHRSLLHRELAQAAVEQACGAASLLIAVSDGVATHLRRMGGAPGRVHVVPNGVDPARFPPRPARRNEAFTIGFVGSLKSWHGLPIAVDAFARLHRRRPESRLLVVGEGPERESLTKALAEVGLSSSVRLTGAVRAAEVPRWLESMDVGVAPYAKAEGFYFSPLKIFEYMAAGLPVVASRIGQIPEIVDDGCNGLLCTPGDPKDLAAALDRLAADSDLRDRLGRNARDTALHKHTWDAVVGTILKLADMVPSFPMRAGSG